MNHCIISCKPWLLTGALNLPPNTPQETVHASLKRKKDAPLPPPPALYSPIMERHEVIIFSCFFLPDCLSISCRCILFIAIVLEFILRLQMVILFFFKLWVVGYFYNSSHHFRLC